MSRKSIAVIGEGITEKFYIESLRGLVPFEVKPKSLGYKASNLKALRELIDESISDNYDYVCCLIDMDTKHNVTIKRNYKKLKDEYHNKSHIKNLFKFFCLKMLCAFFALIFDFGIAANSASINKIAKLKSEVKES